MAKKDNLIQLIASMSPAEKRQFKLACSVVPGDKRYLKLFDALEAETTYNGAALCRQLGLTAKQLADDKHYLNRVLLSNLRSNVPLETDADILYNEFEDARHLVRRGLYTYAAEIAEATLKQARAGEHFELMYNLLSLLHTCYNHQQNYKRMHSIGEECRQLAVLSAERNEMRWITGMASDFSISKHGESGSYDKLMKHELMQKQPEDLNSELARAEWFATTHRYYSTRSAREETYRAILREWQYYQKHTDVKRRFPRIYILASTRMINAEYAIKNYKRMQQLAEQLKLEVKGPAIKISKAQQQYYADYADVMLLLALHGQHQNEKLLEAAAKMHYARMPKYQAMYLFYQAAALLNLQRPAAVVDKLEELLQLGNDVNPDWLGVVRTMIILAQYDMGNHQILPHLVQSTKVWLKRNKVFDKEDELLFSLLAAIVKPNTAAAHKSAWQKLITAIEGGKLTYICDTLHFEQWVRSRAGNVRVVAR
ncbi:MAG TPA: hypothetical protein VK174_05185 [Chitinophagales bacterium]|nr:hypothetical protein [Chitinophagales bacterium]